LPMGGEIKYADRQIIVVFINTTDIAEL